MASIPSKRYAYAHRAVPSVAEEQVGKNETIWSSEGLKHLYMAPRPKEGSTALQEPHPLPLSHIYLGIFSGRDTLLMPSPSHPSPPQIACEPRDSVFEMQVGVSLYAFALLNRERVDDLVVELPLIRRSGVICNPS